MTKQDKSTKKELTTVSRDYTVNLHKACHKIQFKKKAPRALREIRKFAQKNMLTNDIRIDVDVNQFVWHKGIRNIPRRVRVRLTRKVDKEGEGEAKFYTHVGLVAVDSFKGLVTEKSRNQ